MRKLVEDEFRRGASISVVAFPSDGAAIQDTPKLTLVVAGAGAWNGREAARSARRLAEWTRQRGKSPRLYPGALVWCLKKPGRDLREKVEMGLAWKRVAREVAEGTLGGEFDKSDRAELQSKVKDAEEAAKDEVWGGYRFAVVADAKETDGLKVIDLGAGHSSSGETLCGRVIAALKSEALLNESVGAGYIERNWPPALKDSGAWPLASLRQSFLNGSLTRLVDPDAILSGKIVEFVSRGDFGLASGQKPDGTYDRVWFEELIAPDEVAFDAGVFLLRKDFGEGAQVGRLNPSPGLARVPSLVSNPSPRPSRARQPGPEPGATTKTLRLVGSVPPEVWNRLGTKILPKLRSGSDLRIGLEFTVTVKADTAGSLAAELQQILQELGLSEAVKVEEGGLTSR